MLVKLLNEQQIRKVSAQTRATTPNSHTQSQKEANTMIATPVHYDPTIPFPHWGPEGLKSLAAFLAETAESVSLMKPGCGLPENVIVDPPETRAGYSIYPVVFYLWFSGPNPDFYRRISRRKIKKVTPLIAAAISTRFYGGKKVAVVLDKAVDAKFATG